MERVLILRSAAVTVSRQTALQEARLVLRGAQQGADEAVHLLVQELRGKTSAEQEPTLLPAPGSGSSTTHLELRQHPVPQQRAVPRGAPRRRRVIVQQEVEQVPVRQRGQRLGARHRGQEAPSPSGKAPRRVRAKGGEGEPGLGGDGRTGGGPGRASGPEQRDETERAGGQGPGGRQARSVRSAAAPGSAGPPCERRAGPSRAAPPLPLTQRPTTASAEPRPQPRGDVTAARQPPREARPRPHVTRGARAAIGPRHVGGGRARAWRRRWMCAARPRGAGGGGRGPNAAQRSAARGLGRAGPGRAAPICPAPPGGGVAPRPAHARRGAAGREAGGAAALPHSLGGPRRAARPRSGTAPGAGGAAPPPRGDAERGTGGRGDRSERSAAAPWRRTAWGGGCRPGAGGARREAPRGDPACSAAERSGAGQRAPHPDAATAPRALRAGGARPHPVSRTRGAAAVPRGERGGRSPERSPRPAPELRAPARPRGCLASSPIFGSDAAGPGRPVRAGGRGCRCAAGLCFSASRGGGEPEHPFPRRRGGERGLRCAAPCCRGPSRCRSPGTKSPAPLSARCRPAPIPGGQEPAAAAGEEEAA